MNSKVEKERLKQIQDKCQRLLTEMLKDEDNKYCVDCDAKGPRWASWNLGIFLCIRCAGIHRKLGVHISRVKSVNLDTWTPQQVVCLQQMGNSRARAVYEANLPDNFRRPQSEGNLENFIRAKYEHKKYIAREWVAPPLPKVNWDRELEEEAEKLKKKKREVKQGGNVVGVVGSCTLRPLSTPPTAAAAVIPQPLPKPQSCSPKAQRTGTGTQYTDLLKMDTPTKETFCKKNASSDSDLFSSFLNAATAASPDSSTAATLTTTTTTTTTTSSSTRTEEESNFFNQSLSAATLCNNKQQQMTKDSILALYGNANNTFMPSSAAAAAAVNNASFSSYVPSVNGITKPFSRAEISPPQPNTRNLAAGIGSAQFLNNGGPPPFSSNPFYSMAASVGVGLGVGLQQPFPPTPPSQKALFNASAATANTDFQHLQFAAAHAQQQMESLNLNTTPPRNSLNQYQYFQQQQPQPQPTTNHFEINDDDSKSQAVAATTATANFWQ